MGGGDLILVDYRSSATAAVKAPALICHVDLI